MVMDPEAEPIPNIMALNPPKDSGKFSSFNTVGRSI